ncbi:hypothetical protein FE257_010319 [Aspergillus nanangensis]|uniref:Uncharacterized protein n=1 Tax=Aspergillus nanangensis TaxID=2582783 RepID=A0AAD4GRD7_ASPNN|nr:hypothetical protein FE257_010319 [Aspergillus nanangensis]
MAMVFHLQSFSHRKLRSISILIAPLVSGVCGETNKPRDIPNPAFLSHRGDGGVPPATRTTKTIAKATGPEAHIVTGAGTDFATRNVAVARRREGLIPPYGRRHRVLSLNWTSVPLVHFHQVLSQPVVVRLAYLLRSPNRLTTQIHSTPIWTGFLRETTEEMARQPHLHRLNASEHVVPRPGAITTITPASNLRIGHFSTTAIIKAMTSLAARHRREVGAAFRAAVEVVGGHPLEEAEIDARMTLVDGIIHAKDAQGLLSGGGSLTTRVGDTAAPLQETTSNKLRVIVRYLVIPDNL